MDVGSLVKRLVFGLCGREGEPSSHELGWMVLIRVYNGEEKCRGEKG